MKKFFFICLFLFSLTAFAASPPNCSPVNPWPPSDPNFNEQKFCDQFEEAGYCHCEMKNPSKWCRKLKFSRIYEMMLDLYGNISNACYAQGDVDHDVCVAQWEFYLKTSCRKIP